MALEGCEWSSARPGRTLPPGKNRYPLYWRLGGPQGQSGRADNLVPTGIRSRTVQPVVSRYTNWATRPIYFVLLENQTFLHNNQLCTPWFKHPLIEISTHNIFSAPLLEYVVLSPLCLIIFTLWFRHGLHTNVYIQHIFYTVIEILCI